MEATGIYSMPVCHALLAHGEFEQVLVCNAGHVRNVPGRKTDLSDAEWLAHLLECGLLRGSFIPSAEIKAARDVIRYRAQADRARTSELSAAGQRAAGRRDQGRQRGVIDHHQVGAGDGGGAHRR